MAQRKQAGLTLAVETAHIEVLKWLRDIAPVRKHQTLQQPPAVRWQQEVASWQRYLARPDNIIERSPRLAAPTAL